MELYPLSRMEAVRGSHPKAGSYEVRHRKMEKNSEIKMSCG